VIYNFFDPSVLEDQMASSSSAGQVVGGPANVLFTGDFQKQLNTLTAKYANAPLQNYKPFADATLTLRAEPRNQTQKMYAALDPLVQAVLTNPKADPQALLNQAAQQFQQVLDQSASS
jgi:multiple sugar transport system substrate-binding protein